ncbi:MAG: SDR family NAD(P)-dependent oxidoreductase [Chitinophagaceae bacterium]|jgi:3-hydroxy acid dehydrogenase/malonic semialdehyde reductase
MNILITGASSGFGKAMAIKFASMGHSIMITARRADRIEALAKELRDQYQVTVIPKIVDVRDRAKVFSSLENDPFVAELDVLINNAGLALGRDYFEEASLDDWETMLDTNVKGVMYVTRAVLPSMIKRAKGHIINIGSIAGLEVYEKGNGYCASKHALDALSQSMRIDLLRHRIKVTSIHPGAAETEFSLVRFKGDPQKAASVYDGYIPLYAEDIAEVVSYAVHVPEHVCLNSIEMTCTAQANSFTLYKSIGQAKS